MTTVYDVYFYGHDAPLQMTAQELFPLMAHPQAFRFITRVELCGVLSPVSETETKD